MVEISIFLHSLAAGGAERVAVNLANGLANKSCQVNLVLGNEEGEFLSLIRDEVTVVDLDMNAVPPFGILTAVPALRVHLRDVEPDILLSIANQNNIAALLACHLISSPPYVIVSDHLSPSSPQFKNSMKNDIVVKLAAYLYPWADCRVTVSEGTAEGMAAATGLPKSDFITIHNPIVDDQLRKQAKAPVSHEWFQDDRPTVVSFGRLVKRKDVETIIRSIQLLNQRRNVRLAVIGDGPDRKRLESIVTGHDLESSVEFLGFVENPYRYLSRASVFVLASRWEGFGNVLVEAMACGCPVVSTNCPDGPREILADGFYGPLVPIGDSNAMSEAILETLDDPISTEILRNRAADFSTDSIIDEYERLVFPVEM